MVLPADLDLIKTRKVQTNKMLYHNILTYATFTPEGLLILILQCLQITPLNM